MKKITCIFLVVCLCLNLAGCSSGSENEKEGHAKSEKEWQEEALERAGKYVKKMTLDEKIGQLFIVDADKLLKGSEPVTELSPELLKAIETYQIGGIVFGSQNIRDAAQITALTAGIRDATGAEGVIKVPLYIGTEEEGGGEKSIAVKSDTITSTGYISPSEMGENMTETQFEDTGEVIAGELMELGFNLNFAPTADVVEPERLVDMQAVQDSVTAVIGERPVDIPPAKKLSKAKRKKRHREHNKSVQEYDAKYDAFLKKYTEDQYKQSCFSDDKDKTGQAVMAMVKGMHAVGDNGICTVLKTFPGISSVARYHKLVNTEIETGLSRLRRVNLAPFSDGIDAGTDFIMVGHSSLGKVDKGTPSSLSSTIMTELLRSEMGFEGIIMTEQMDVPVITNEYTTEQATLRALVSGADMIYDPENLEEAISAVKSAVIFGEIDEKMINQAVLRILQNKILRNIYPEDAEKGNIDTPALG